MSENLDLVRSIFADWERGDYFRSAEWAHPEIEFVRPEGPDPGRWRGLDGMAQGWRSQLSVWENWRVEVDEYRELDDERVLVLTRQTGRGKTSGLEVEQMQPTTAGLFHISEGKVTKLVAYWDRDHALTDLGLKE